MDINKLKNLDIDKILKLAIVAGIILVGFSVFYYYVIFLPQKERVKVEREQQEQVVEELKEQREKEEARLSLDTCIANAEERYSDQWNRECKARGELTSRCLSLYEMTFKEYQEEKGLEGIKGFADYYKERDECSCSLPTAIANDIGDYRDGLKAECFKKYPQK